MQREPVRNRQMERYRRHHDDDMDFADPTFDNAVPPSEDYRRSRSYAGSETAVEAALLDERRRRVAAERELEAMSGPMRYQSADLYDMDPGYGYDQQPPIPRPAPRVRRSVIVRHSMYGQSQVQRHRQNEFW